MDINNLSSTQVGILALLRASDLNDNLYTPIPGRIHLVKELFAVYMTDIGEKILSDLHFEADNFGPFDETIFAALDELVDAGIVNYTSTNNQSKIEITLLGKQIINPFWEKIRPEIRDLFTLVKIKYNDKSSTNVLEEIYSAHPEMARNSVHKVAQKYKGG